MKDPDRECGRCSKTCIQTQESQNKCGVVTMGDTVMDYGGLCVDVSEILDILNRFDDDTDIANALRVFINTRTFNADPCELCNNYRQGIVCTEVLGLYCPLNDTIYYNIDYVERWIKHLYLANVGTLMKDLAKELENELRSNANLKLGISLGLVKKIAAEATRKVAMTYLISHERYHWANGPRDFPPNEEALATAHGIYTAYTEALNPLASLTAVFTGYMHMHIHYIPYKIPYKISGLTTYVLSTLLEAYFKHLTLARLSYDNTHFKDYSDFTSYLNPIPGKPTLTIDYRGIITKFTMNNNQYVQVVYGNHDIVEVEVKVSGPLTPTFRGSPRARYGDVHEEYKHCENYVNTTPDPWLIPINSTTARKIPIISQRMPQT